MALYVSILGQGIALQPGYGRATETLYRDSVDLRCVVTEKAMRAQQTRSSAHDKASAPRLGAHDRGILIFVPKNFLQWKKKKGTP